MSVQGGDNTIDIYRGSSKTLELTITKDDGTAVDLTSAILVLTVKRDLADSLPIFQKTNKNSGPDVTITNAIGGIVRFKINPADTQKLDVRQYSYDIWVILASGNQYPVITPSVFNVQAGVTIF
jgi:hypothetical protein